MSQCGTRIMMRTRNSRWLMLTCIVPFLLAVATTASEPQPLEHELTDASKSRLQALVVQLNSACFADREEATQQLIQLSYDAIDHLTPLTTSKNRELRQRSQQIVATIARNSRPERLKRFAAGDDLVGDMSLPCWEDMRRITADEAEARRIWTAVLQTEWDFLKRLESESGDPFQIVLDRLVELNSTKHWKRNMIARESVIALMVGTIASSSDASQGGWNQTPDHVAIQIYSLLHQVDAAANNSAWNQVAFRDLVGEFIVIAQGPTSVYQGLTLAMRHDLDRQGLVSAERVLRQGTALPHVKQYAILAMARFGGKEHVATLEDLLDDPGVLYTGKFNGEHRQKIECQVRDLALASVIHLTGGDPRAVGFTHLQTNHAYVFQPHTVGFTSETARTGALARFRGEPVPATAASPNPDDLNASNEPAADEQIEAIFEDIEDPFNK